MNPAEFSAFFEEAFVSREQDASTYESRGVLERLGEGPRRRGG
jgi:hypothetical protein